MGKERCCFPDACFALLFQVRIPWRETEHDERPDIVCFEEAFRRTWYLFIFIAIIYQSLLAISNDGYMSSWRARGLAWKEEVLPRCAIPGGNPSDGTCKTWPLCQPCQEIHALDRVTRRRVKNKRPPLRCLRRHAGAPLLLRLS